MPHSTVMALPSIWKPPASEVSGALLTTIFTKLRATGDKPQRWRASESTSFSNSSSG
jgi:hypothetical protein